MALGMFSGASTLICLALFFTIYNGIVIITATEVGTLQNVPQPVVRFNSNGTLKIVQFTDLHFGEAPDTDWGPEDDINSTRVITDILDWETPDFVVFTGDQVTGDGMFPNVSSYIHMMLQPLVEKRYRWASIYGNHDIGLHITRLDILRTEQSYGELCYTKEGNQELPGVSNYFLPIYGPESNDNQTEEERPVMIWWFFDSRGGFTQDGRQPYFVDESVVEWFGNESSQLSAKWGTLPSLVFVHIPPVEYVSVQEGMLSNENPQCSGLVDDSVTPQEKDSGLMEALRRAGGVKTVFVGHEHGNSWCCYHSEIELCYNRHTGYGGYGQWARGARVIQLDVNNLTKQKNYVRLEDGEITDVFPKEHEEGSGSGDGELVMEE